MVHVMRPWMRVFASTIWHPIELDSPGIVDTCTEVGLSSLVGEGKWGFAEVIMSIERSSERLCM